MEELESLEEHELMELQQLNAGVRVVRLADLRGPDELPPGLQSGSGPWLEEL